MNIDLTQAEMARLVHLIMAASNLTDPVDGGAHAKLSKALANFPPPDQPEIEDATTVASKWRAPI